MMDSTTEHSPEKRVELILQQLEDVPPLPGALAGVIPVAGSNPSAVADAVTLLSGEGEWSQRIIRLLEAGNVAGPGEIDSIDRALVRRGFEIVRLGVVAVAVYRTLNGAPEQAGASFNRDGFWKHSIAVGCCAQLIAEQMAGLWGKDADVEPFEALVAGLLHDCGKMVLAAVLPKSFERATEAVEMLRGNIADVERTVIGIDHMVAGKRLAERWALPASVRDCIWLHGQAPDALPATVSRPRLVNLITLADQIVREQHIGYSGNYQDAVARQTLLDAIGVTEEQLAGAREGLLERVEKVAGALALREASGTALLTGAVAQANRELDRVQLELKGKSRKLANRARFFEALAGFQGELRPDAPPQTVLRAVGQTAVSLLGVTSCCAFSLIPGQNFAEVLLFDGDGEMFETMLVDCPQRPATPPAGDGPVLVAGQEMEWLLSMVAPRLSHDQGYWICLDADGGCIGGVVWGGAGGEATRLGGGVQEISAIASGWGMALRTAQIREEARSLAEQLAEANRKLQGAQAEILRSRTIITVGEMAAGAAHEMNNPLAVISGRSQLLAMQLSDAKQKAAAHLIHEQSHRLTDIITELMHFAKPVPPAPGETDLADLIDRALHEAKLQADTVDRTVEITIGDVPKVIVDPDQVMSALMELFDNAFNATDPVKGHIQVNAAFDPFSRKVAVTISDNGCGMDPATLKRAFDPFFSSRPAGRRRGMGLAKALRWVEASGGSIRLESRQGHGTRGLVLLPASQPAATQARKAPRRAVQ